MMKTLLLQNQQIIIQQQNMMFMVMKQFQTASQNPSMGSQSTISLDNDLCSNMLSTEHDLVRSQSQKQHSSASTQQTQQTIHMQSQEQLHQHQQQAGMLQSQQHLSQTPTTNSSSQQQHQTVATPLSHILTPEHNHNQTPIQSQQQHHHHQEQHPQIYSQSSVTGMESHDQLQMVSAQLQDNLANYLTPAASEQDPISDKTDDDLTAFLEGDGMLHNNLLYNPSTDIGSITPYKNSQQQHQTPSYYSSGCESLTTPRVEHQRQSTTISHNVVKNLADSFKSPTKPKINVQIMAGSATMKNRKAKIIQSMNISEFLRHVHPESSGESQKAGS